ncbi:MAG TPA: hypothetical protein VGL25_02255 [Casimicrobiaceae bacterium]|jgi:hypothetical protein
MNVQSVLGLILLSVASGAAFAGVVQLPEPGILELLAVGAVAAVVVAIRKRRK